MEKLNMNGLIKSFEFEQTKNLLFFLIAIFKKKKIKGKCNIAIYASYL